MNRSVMELATTLRRRASSLVGACLLTSLSCGELSDHGEGHAEGDAPSTHTQQATPGRPQPERAARELCVADPENAAVHVFDMTKNGDQPPLRSLGTNVAQIKAPTAMAIAETHDELLVAEGSSIRTFHIDDEGDVAPRRVLDLAASQLAYDPTHDLLFALVRGQVQAFPRDAAGATAPLWTLQPNLEDAGNRLAYDHVRDEVIVVGEQSVAIYDWNATGGVPKYAHHVARYGSKFRGVAVDASSGEIYLLDGKDIDPMVLRRFTRARAGRGLDQRSFYYLTDDDISGSDTPFSLKGFGIDPDHGEAVIMMDDHNGARLLVYDLATGRFKHRIAGGHTGLTGDGCLAVNRARHEYTVGTRQSRSLLTFARPQSGVSPHDLTPRRIGPPFGDGPLGLAADVARDELYLTSPHDPAVHVLSISSGAELRRVIDPERPITGRLLFDPESDRLFVNDGNIRVYARPTGDTMTPLHRYDAPSFRFFAEMALDTPNQRLFAHTYDTIVAFDLHRASSEPALSLTPAVNRGPFVPSGRPFPPPLRGVRQLYIHKGQLVASVYDGALAVFAMLGIPPVPTNPPVFRTLDVALRDTDDFLIDARSPSTLWLARTTGEARVDAYQLGLFAGPRPVRSIAGPSTHLGSTSALTICR